MVAEQVITEGGTDRRNRLCRCSNCGIEAVCRPDFDFYSTEEDDKGPLLCESCLYSYMRRIEERGKKR